MSKVMSVQSDIRLSEAIRLGAMIRRQITGRYFFAGGTCAAGALMEALGLITEENHLRASAIYRDSDNFQMFPVVKAELSSSENCPECRGGWHCIRDLIVHLNDQCGWTREQIADWVEEIERKRGLMPAAECAVENAGPTVEKDLVTV